MTKPDPQLDAQISALSSIGHTLMEISRRIGVGIKAVDAALKRAKEQRGDR